MKRLLCLLPLVGLSLASCTTASNEDSALEAKFGSETIGGDRPARVVVPSSYDGIAPLPLFFLLHGYTVTADIQDAYFRLSSRVDEDNFLLVLPDGTLDETGTTFWNSWSESTEPVDDVGYLMGPLDEMEDTWKVDSSRVYFLGHSNGGYMSYRLACEHADFNCFVGKVYQEPIFRFDLSLPDRFCRFLAGFLVDDKHETGVNVSIQARGIQVYPEVVESNQLTAGGSRVPCAWHVDVPSH